MDDELQVLEQKISQVVQLSHRLREENVELRQQLASAVSDNKRLSEKINSARTRLEALMRNIPVNEK